MTANTATKQPQLNNVENLFLLNYDQTKQFDPALRLVQTKPYPDHQFKLYTGERLDDMVASIKIHGVMQPIIVRPLGRYYQILSGHNRVNASQIAGLETIPAIILHDISDEDAYAIVIQTNLMQRGFRDLSHSERAAVIALHHTKMFSQGKRNDILQQLEVMQNVTADGQKTTSVQKKQKLDSRTSIADQYDLNATRIARYIYLDKLVDALKVHFDNASMTLSVSTALSFLTEAEQKLLAKCVEMNHFKVTGAKADIRRTYSQKGTLDEESLYLILSGEKKNGRPTKRPPALRRSTIKQYFSGKMSSEEILDEIDKALAFYQKHKDDKEV